MDSRWTPGGVLIQFQESTWTPDGLHQEAWLSVTTSKYVLLVMPFLHVFDSPPFHCRREVVEVLHVYMSD
jgi:hypothetical protein